MAGNVTVKQDNTGQVVDGIDSAIGVALEKIGLLAENYAAKKCPVDTGFWRSVDLTGNQTRKTQRAVRWRFGAVSI